jgi:hypothetical protein
MPGAFRTDFIVAPRPDPPSFSIVPHAEAMRGMNLLDRAISFVAPRAALQRARTRVALEPITGDPERHARRFRYDGATAGRRANGWYAASTDASVELMGSHTWLRNPLHLGRRRSTPNRILSLLVAHPGYSEGHRPWTHGGLAFRADCLQAKGVLKHGEKKRLAAYNPDGKASYERLEETFETGALASLLAAYGRAPQALLDWWRAHLTIEIHPRAQFPADIAARHGARALMETPRAVVGTIHSVKGGQADVVYLFPGFSRAGDDQYARGGTLRDSVIRLFYVGATRAREALYICQRNSGMAVTI